MHSPKGYLQKFELEMPFRCDLDILDFLVSRRTPTYSMLSKKCWILFVLEITKILSSKESFGIGKFYNQIFYKNIKTTAGLDCFKPVLQLIEPRSEEHTSELQSRENLVCRLLLEKKNGLSAMP